MANATRPFGLWTATALVVGGMIGSGVFLLPATLAPYGWTGVAAWIASTGGALVIAYVLVTLAAVRPQASGLVAIVGDVLHPLAGALVGWAYWVAVWCTNAAIAVAAVSYLAMFVPWLSQTPLHGAVAAIVLVWLLTALNSRGAAAAGQFQVVTTLLKLIPLLAVLVILVGLAFAGGLGPPPLPPLWTIVPNLAAPVTLTLFALLGFEAASVAAARVCNPAVNVFRATMIGTALTGLFYILVCSGIALVLPSVARSPAPLATFVEVYWGHGPALAIGLFAAIAAIGALNGWTLVVGEVPRGMAADGLLPRWFAKTSARDVPVGVLVLSAVLASLLILANGSKSLSGIYEFMILLTTASTLYLYAAACLAAIWLRIALPFAIVGLAFALWAMWGAGIEASGLSLLLMLTGLPVYALRDRTGAV